MASASVAPLQSGVACGMALEHLRAAGLVRLDDVEATALAVAIDGIPAHSVELFGSRADPASHGGDIDLLILSDAPRFQTARRVSTRFFTNCEERIDVVVLDPEHLTASEAAFLESLHRVKIA